MSEMLNWADNWEQNGRAKHEPAKIEWHFFASYHGHSLCDSQAGIVSQLLERIRVSLHDPLGGSAVPSTALEYATIINSRMTRARAIVLPSITRPKVRQELKTLAGIRSHHSFLFNRVENSVTMRRWTGSAEERERKRQPKGPRRKPRGIDPANIIPERDRRPREAAMNSLLTVTLAARLEEVSSMADISATVPYLASSSSSPLVVVSPEGPGTVLYAPGDR